MAHLLSTLAVGLGCTVAAVLGADALVSAADHGDSPQVRADTRADINDLYIFASPATPADTVIAMTVCPVAGITAPKEFATNVKYQFGIDTNGDANPDQTYTMVFKKPDAAGHQKFSLTGPNKVKATGTTEDLGVTFGTGGKVFAGLRDDPFFFDLIGFKKGLAFSATTSRNFFNGLNAMAIVIEVPTTSFGTLTNSKMGVWARTQKGKKQIDRMGRPAINTVLISDGSPGGKKDQFNSTLPKDDVAKWRTEVVGNLMAPPLSRTAQDAGALADVLLPDILTYDPTNPGGFLNGRKLTDDVIDAELDLLSNHLVTTDFVANDSTFLAVFPYLGVPNP
jgi:hypothetical protein